MHDILYIEGLEIELIRGEVVGGDCFGIIIYHYGLIALGAYCPDRMHSGIVEFHALPYAYRA